MHWAHHEGVPITKGDDTRLRETIGKLAPVLERPIMAKVRDLLVVFIIRHRAVALDPNLHQLQRDLLALILELEERHSRAKASLNREHLKLKLHQVSAEELRAAPALAEFFALKRALWACRRLGDSIAWKALKYDRFYIEVVGVGEHPGHMWGKDGLGAEIDALETAWAGGTPALLHGITTCLRAGDVSVRGAQGWMPEEIKKSPLRNRDSRQKAVLSARRALLTTGTETTAGRRLIRAPSVVPLTHDLPSYAVAVDHAMASGAGGAVIEPRGNVITLHAPTLSALEPLEAGALIEAELAANALRPLGEPAFVVRGWSEDKEQHSQFGMPYTSYPFPPEACADLATGFMQMITHLDLRQVARSFELAGGRVAEITPDDAQNRWLRVSLNQDRVWLPELIGERMLFEAVRPACIAASVLDIASRGLRAPNERVLNAATHLSGEAEVWQ